MFKFSSKPAASFEGSNTAVLLPSNEAAGLDENLNTNFKQFNDNLQSYFNNFSQAVGTAKFDNKKAG